MEEKKIKEVKEKEVKLDEKVVVRSIAPWVTGAKRILSVGDIQIQPNGTVTISREELIAQGQSGNKLLTGIDGIGSHATLYIDDEYTRKELGFETNESKQNVVSNESVKHAFELKTDKAFEKYITDNFVTRAEKAFLMSAIKTLKIDASTPYPKIAFCEKYTGNKL